MNEIKQEIERQKVRMAVAYQKRAEADDEIKESNSVIQSLQFALDQLDTAKKAESTDADNESENRS